VSELKKGKASEAPAGRTSRRGGVLKNIFTIGGKNDRARSRAVMEQGHRRGGEPQKVGRERSSTKQPSLKKAGMGFHEPAEERGRPSLLVNQVTRNNRGNTSIRKNSSASKGEKQMDKRSRNAGTSTMALQTEMRKIITCLLVIP